MLSFNSKIIITNKPKDALTGTKTTSLFEVIDKLKRQHCGIVYISHRIQEIFAICDEVTVLCDGQFVGKKKVAD